MTKDPHQEEEKEPFNKEEATVKRDLSLSQVVAVPSRKRAASKRKVASRKKVASRRRVATRKKVVALRREMVKLSRRLSIPVRRISMKRMARLIISKS